MPSHEQFEELSVLAASGHITEDDRHLLELHLAVCESCRHLMDDSETLSACLDVSAEDHSSTQIPLELWKALETRARSEGLLASHREATQLKYFFRYIWRYRATRYAVTAAILIVTALCSFNFGRNAAKEVPPKTQQLATSTLKDRLGGPNVDEEIPRLQSELNVLKERLHQARQALASAEISKRGLESKLSEFQLSSQQLQRELSEQQSKVGRLNREIAVTRTQEDADHLAATVAEAELRHSKELETHLTAELKKAKQLQSELAEVQRLIVDRNLHVFEVREGVDQAGKPSRAFGRIFWTEGQTLEFYAYDLNDSNNVSSKSSFYVWGETPKEHVLRLGKFQLDSAAEGRWFLRVTNPKLLTQIISVFVTEESGKDDGDKPSGERILSRNLKDTVGHP